MSDPNASIGSIGLPYDNQVFINCPFDDGYRPLFHAIAFAILACGFTPRSALEITDGGTPRIAVIVSLIRACRLAVHDISRIELTDDGLPRFNMPLELGLWLGAGHFGDQAHRGKKCLILDAEQSRYRKFISDIAGQDPSSHDNDPATAIRRVRDFLLTVCPEGQPVPPGGAHLAQRFAQFQSELPLMCDDAQITPDELTFIDRVMLVRRWLTTVESPGRRTNQRLHR